MGKNSEQGESDKQRDIQNVLAHAIEAHQAGNIDEAKELYQFIINIQAEHSDALHLLGLINNRQGDTKLAYELIKRAIKFNPKAAHYHYNLGTVYQQENNLSQAIKSYKKSIKLKPDYPSALENLGVCLQDKGSYIEATNSYRAALKLNPNSETALLNLGTIKKNLGEVTDAIKYFDRVLAISPLLPEALCKKSHSLLAQGDFKNGWYAYQWSYATQEFIATNPVRSIPFPKWGGGSLNKKTILVVADQGIGDEIMFSSCLTDLVQDAQRVIVECSERLLPLFKRNFSEITFIARPENLEFQWSASLGDINFFIKLSELPIFYRNKLDDFPKTPSKLSINPEKASQWRSQLNALPESINIGISWRGGSSDRTRTLRSIPLQQWGNLLKKQPVNFINLQYGNHSEEIELFNRSSDIKLHTLDGFDAAYDIDSAAALISELDLVISIDNSTIHIAGSIGVPTWVILPFQPDWRWMLNRNDTVWYESLILFRAKTTHDKEKKSLLKDMSERLTQFLSKTQIKNLARVDPPVQQSENNAVSNLTATTHQPYALLLNDTSAWYHWGCSCTSIAIHQQLRLKWEFIQSIPIHETNALSPIPQTTEHFDDINFFQQFEKNNPRLIQKISNASYIYINGEGTLHNINQANLGLLYLAYIARYKFNKKVSIINHSCYPNDGQLITDSLEFNIYQKIYRGLDYIAIREPTSLELMSKEGLKITQSFDCLPLFIQQHYQSAGVSKSNNIIIAGSVNWGRETILQIKQLIIQLHKTGYTPCLLVGASAFTAGDDIRLVNELSTVIGTECQLTYAHSEQQWLRTIDEAQLLISGRFHYTIAAAFLNTAFIVMESNTPKITGLLEMLQSNSFISVEESQLADKLLTKANEIINGDIPSMISPQLKNKLTALALNNFNELD